MLGTPRKTVAPWSAMAALTWRGSKRSTGIRLRPWSRGMSMPTVAAKAWNMGRTTRMRSRPGVRARACITAAVLAHQIARG